jgi:UDP-N-acetylglucosamine 2-epimerase (non-hydrolysing)
MRIAIILGTRPEIIKMSPVIKCCKKNNIEYFVLHTGQHFNFEMDGLFFKELGLDPPEYNLSAGETEHLRQIGVMIRGIQTVLMKEKQDVVFVQGDTSSVLAGALAAQNLGIPLAHHEAGLRCQDTRILEETNRIITDHISDYLFVPTQTALQNLKKEGINKCMYLTGNTVVDVVHEHIQKVEARYEIIFPIHPRTKKVINKLLLHIPDRIRVIEPVGFHAFLRLEKEAMIILTDSGGVQEEACILKTPCVTLRDTTERPETLIDGINILAGIDPDSILDAVDRNMDKQNVNSINPFGDGKAAEKMISIMIRNFCS